MAVQPPVEAEDGAANPIYRVYVTPEAHDNPACQGLFWDLRLPDSREKTPAKLRRRRLFVSRLMISEKLSLP